MAFKSSHQQKRVVTQPTRRVVEEKQQIESVNLDDLSVVAQFFSPGPVRGTNLVFQWTKQIDLNNSFSLNNTGQQIIINVEGTYSLEMTYDYVCTSTSIDKIQIRSPPASENYIMHMHSIGATCEPAHPSSITQSARVFHRFLSGEKFDVFAFDGPQGSISNLRITISRLGR